MRGTERLVLEQVAEDAHRGHGGRHLLAIGVQRELGVVGERRNRNGLGDAPPLGHETAEGCAPLTQICDLATAFARMIEAKVRNVVVAKR